MKIQTFLLLAILLVAGCVGQPVGTTTGNTTTTTASGPTQGRLVMGITDEALNASSVTSLKMTVDGVAIHRTDTDAWITLSTQSRTYDLMELDRQDVVKLLAEATLEQGIYNQIRLSVSRVEATIDGNTSTAILPSSELRIPVRIAVDSNDTSAVTLDFDANRSLHRANDGRVVMAPVIMLRSEAGVRSSADSAGNLLIRDGTVIEETTVGTDISGNVGVGVGVDPEARINIGVGGGLSIGGSTTT